jgi:preprotein translocase subunit SecD
MCAHPRTTVETGDEVLIDQEHRSCYIVGPVLLTGVDVNSDSVFYDPTDSQWSVDLHWANNAFLTTIARPLVNHEIAIVLNHFVLSAPQITASFSGRDLELSENYTRATAITIAASIMGTARSKVRIATFTANG